MSSKQKPLRKIKVSVFLPEDIHQKLKIASVHDKVSIQKIFEDYASKTVEEDSQTTFHTQPEKRKIKDWQADLKEILESGHEMAILNCTAAIDVAKCLIEEAKKEPVVLKPSSRTPVREMDPPAPKVSAR